MQVIGNVKGKDGELRAMFSNAPPLPTVKVAMEVVEMATTASDGDGGGAGEGGGGGGGGGEAIATRASTRTTLQYDSAGPHVSPPRFLSSTYKAPYWKAACNHSSYPASDELKLRAEKGCTSASCKRRCDPELRSPVWHTDQAFRDPPPFPSRPCCTASPRRRKA